MCAGIIGTIVADQLKRVCLITGAARGIGAATAAAVARQGYAVCVNYREASDAAKIMTSTIRGRGGEAMSFRADVSRTDEVAALFAAIDREFGPVTALVNNAGISGGRHELAALDAETFARVVEVNLVGTFLCTKEAALRMARSRGGQGGAIVNLSTTAVRTGGRRIAAYVAAKAGTEGLMRALAPELAEEGIRINTVAPGIIATEQQPLDDAAWRASATASVPLGRLGTAGDVAAAILWLLSDAAAYVTGTVLDVAGGR
jgi:NAD(P)-dependent dehydrogenase (short-subunit alcohol dehydrogenase family)